METTDLDSLRMNIFKDLMVLDRENVAEVCAFIASLKRKSWNGEIIYASVKKEYSLFIGT